MNKLYKKSELWFALCFIIIYVVGTSIVDGISEIVGLEKSATLVFHLLMSGILFVWLKKNGLLSKYGICKTCYPAKKYLYYIPLILIMSCNL